MDIAIIGAGISGLTAAHELSNLNYKITIIERNEDVGGIARTYQNDKQKDCPIEYSWRAFGPYYQNIYNVMKNIPLGKRTILDNLFKLDDTMDKTECNKTEIPYGHSYEIEMLDYFRFIPEFIKYIYSCRERNIKNYSHVNYRKYLEKNKYSKLGIDKLGKTIGPFWGMDYNNASLFDIFHTIEMILQNKSSKLDYNITKYPTNDAWFHPWIKYLKSKNVNILTNHEVKKINIENNIIKSITIFDKNNRKTFTKNYKYYINCTGPEVLEKFLNRHRKNRVITPLYKNIFNVAKNGRQIQMSIYYYLDTKIMLGSGFIYLPNSPWLLIVLPYAHIWGDKYLKKYCSKNIKEVVSIGICQPYEKGNLIKKAWENCTKEEIKTECWNQLINDEQFLDTLCCKKDIKDVNILDFKIWTSYKFKNGKLDTYEPKWGNNTNTIQYRPNAKTDVKNLVLAGAYTNTSTSLFSMESACESGKLAAKQLCKIDNRNENIYLYTKQRFNFTMPIRKIDKFFYNIQNSKKRKIKSKNRLTKKNSRKNIKLNN